MKCMGVLIWPGRGALRKPRYWIYQWVPCSSLQQFYFHGHHGMTPLQGTCEVVKHGITATQFYKAFRSAWPPINGTGGGRAPFIGKLQSPLKDGLDWDG